MRVGFATSNRGKLAEASRILSGVGIEVVALHCFLDSEEVSNTYLANAVHKALAAARYAQHPVLTEDSGLEVDALHGEPGVRSARYAGPHSNDAANNARLVRELQRLGIVQSAARYRSVAVIASSSGRWISGEGVMEGTVFTDPRGLNGFGYDPYFAPEGMDRRAAELESAEKNAISHRAQALKALAQTVADGGLSDLG